MLDHCFDPTLRAAALALALLGTGVAVADPVPSAARLRHGAYLAEVANCAGCHTRPGGAPFADGRAIATAFGTVQAPGLAPLADDAAFLAVLRQGLRPDGTPLYPTCPYPFFARANEDDLLAIKDYLRSRALPAAPSPPEAALDWPFATRAALFAWQEAYLRPARFAPQPHRSAEWNRGAYLVETLGHCAACHRGAESSDNALESSTRELFARGWLAPTPAPALTAATRFDADALAEYLRVGLAGNPAHERAHGHLGRLARSDLRALAIYLKAPPTAAERRALFVADEAAPAEGRALYARYCAGCHREQGQGIPDYVPSLRGAPTARWRADGLDLVEAVLLGAPAERARAFSPHVLMPSFGAVLDDQQVAAVVNRLRAWHRAAPPVTADQVRRVRAGE